MAKPSVSVPKPKPSNQYKVYDLQNEQDRQQFSKALVFDTFAVIKIPDEHKASLSELFNIFRQLFNQTKTLQCEENGRYVGYTSTEAVKESLWFYLNQDGSALMPRILNKKCALYESNNEQKICKAFTAYSSVADDVIHAVLRHQCVSEQAYIECYNSLFPQNDAHATISASCNQNEKKTNDDGSTMHHQYLECAVYNGYRKNNRLSINNLAAINYFGANNKKRKKNWFETLPKLYKTNKDEDETSAAKKEEPAFPCEEHMDYTLVSLLMADQPGLQCRDIMNFEWINIDEIISASPYDRSEVIVVLTGLTFGTLFHDRVACYHSVRNLYGNNDRLSFPLFVYADPNGVIDTSLIKTPDNHRIVLRNGSGKKLTCCEYLAKNMHASVNF
mmetsp:Transcript_38129/g.62548  ORF Transcript_38129/g.62548 Transcript_38129/m.62548 type:complete len:389 (+) Transcript_38129:32-1198(+)